MAGIPSIGDILMLSQLAWKIGRAFTAGRKNAPEEFLDVEKEVNALAKALKLLAETLFADADDSILSKAEKDTRVAVATLLLSCQQTLHDLDSIIEQYQVIRKQRTSGGYTVDRSWSDLVLANYQNMMWTTEGGNIQALRNMLKMHTSSITLTMQALQSKSLQRLEATVLPMADKVDDIHNNDTGDLEQKLDEVHRVVVSIGGATPSLKPLDIRSRQPTPSRTPTSQLGDPFDNITPEPLTPRRSPRSPTPQETPELAGSDISSAPSIRRDSQRSQRSQRSQLENVNASTQYSERRSSLAFSNTSGPGSPATGHERTLSQREPRKLATVEDTPELEDSTSPMSQPRSNNQFRSQRLPPPAVPPDSTLEIRPAPPRHPMPRDTLASNNINLMPAQDPEAMRMQRSTTSASQHDAFERSVFRNSAILCDLRGTLIEYTHSVEDDGNPFGVEMVEAMGDCRICVVRKRDSLPDGNIRMTTSIWCFSEDRSTRMQQKLLDNEEYIPYSSFFQPEKVSITVQAELRFHNTTYGAQPLKLAKTTWVNYVFEDIQAANLFQNELMGRNLVASYKTEKTMRLHEGISGVLAYSEQMCGMENLRIWEDETNAGVIAMLHFSAQFRNGYLAFYLNSSTNPIRVKDEGGKEVKIKGLHIPLLEPGRKHRSGLERNDSKGGGEGARRGSDAKKFITGARVEFQTEEEKVAFVNKVREVQKTMIALPDLTQ